jgi:isoleucyl-tRNA synthetase
MPDDSSPSARDYRDTVFLPDTVFPMRAGLPQKEPEILAKWAADDLYGALRKDRQARGAELFVLHDGPPYANGAIHIGHALNKLLKDFVVRSQFLLGKDVDYRPGWDCHGLPIEWKIEEAFRAEGRPKGEVPSAEFRKRCREYAAGWIEIQKTEFQRLGVLGDWARRYATMDYGSEAAIVGEFHKFLMTGQLYRGSKPVMWSPVERTALADAEVEYAPHTSPTVWVKFPVIGKQTLETVGTVTAGGTYKIENVDPALVDAAVVIWTTTPWTIPANRAVSFNPKISYALYEVREVDLSGEFAPWAKVGDKVILAEKLSAEVFAAAKITKAEKTASVDPAGLRMSHPLASQDTGYSFMVPMLAGDHVTEEAGTGFVHTAPGHGADDYLVWLKSGQSLDSIPDTVDPDGAYYPHVPLFGGLKVIETEGKKDKIGKFGPANKAVMDALIAAGNLLARGRVEHSYPHSWRSKAPVIFRNTPQWFIRMDQPLSDGHSLRQRALASIAMTAFHPDQGRNRIGAMVETRPDWLISRQRAWGAPLAMFVDKTTGEPLRDPAVNERIIKAIADDGADAWFIRPDTDFLGDLDPANYEKITDILDVWFDSGSTHAFTLEHQPETRWPADLYLEGSDQHRGWFQSSLLESCGTRGRAPYKGVLTHGFTLDESGEKMSKSKGNTTEPQVIIKESGAEILRLWVGMVDYAEDQRIGKTILQTTVDGYRKLRNTLRYLLGGLAGFEEGERLPFGQMPPLERYILHRMWELDAQVRASYESYDFRAVWRVVSDFAASDLSALYFDIRRDSLYCDSPSSDRRRACRTVMDLAFERLTAWLAPIAPFTTEEAWTTRFPDAGSNCLRVIPDTPAAWRNDAEAARWARVAEITGAVTLALEEQRREKLIGSALDAAVVVQTKDADAFEDLDAAEVFRTSQATVIAHGAEAAAVTVEPLSLPKCARSWRRVPDVGSDPRYPDLSARDAAVVAEIDAGRAA